MEYRETLEVTKKELERWNFLLSKNLDEMIDKEMEEYNAKPYDNEGGWYIEFEDGSNVTIDLASGGSNYYDEIIWHSADGSKERCFDCFYEIGGEPDKLEVDGNTYFIEWKVID